MVGPFLDKNCLFDFRKVPDLNLVYKISIFCEISTFVKYPLSTNTEAKAAG